MKKFIASLVLASVLASSLPSRVSASQHAGDLSRHGDSGLEPASGNDVREALERLQDLDDTTLEKAKRRLMSVIGKANHSKEARKQISKLNAEEKQALMDRLGAQSEAELLELFVRDLDGRRGELLRKLSKISGRELVKIVALSIAGYPAYLFIGSFFFLIFTGPIGAVILPPLLLPYVTASVMVTLIYDYLGEVLR